MACNCTCNILKSTVSTVAVNSGTTAVVLTPDNALAPNNENRIELVVTTSVPAVGMALPAQVTLNGTTVPLFDKFGNIMYGANIRTRYVMRIYYGTNGTGGTAHAIVINQPVGRVCS